MNIMQRVLLLCLIAYSQSTTISENAHHSLSSIIETVNSAGSTWTAGHNFHSSVSKSALKRLCGTKLDTIHRAEPSPSEHLYAGIASEPIPSSFDARKRWPACRNIGHINDQGNCGSCWAVSTTSVLTDRFCIATNGNFKNTLSADDLLTCCMDCGFGCDGGCPCCVWWHLTKHGIVTGGDHDSKEGCKPYSLKPCDHHVNSTLPLCSVLPDQSTPNCHFKCSNRKHPNSYFKDTHRVKSYHKLNNSVEDIQKEIFAHGPVQATFTVYEDFYTYKSGVYQHVSGKSVGGHAVKMIGWGEENGIPYWLIVNSWNKHWGDEGFVKFVRGRNECNIESGVRGAVPDLDHRSYN